MVSRIKTWEELTIQDNFLFQKVMQNKRICKHLIERILDIKIQEITFPDAEKSIDIRYDSKGIRLDVYVKDETGRVFDIEMQCTNGVDDELAKRTRYYQGMIDMEILEKGELYSGCSLIHFSKNNICSQIGAKIGPFFAFWALISSQ